MSDSWPPPFIREDNFNSLPIIKLLLEQQPERTDIAELLFNCETGWWENEYKKYIYFVDAQFANRPGPTWQIEGCVTISSSEQRLYLIC